MKWAVGRLMLTAALFLMWLGYLLYLVMHTPRLHEVLSRPQFLVSDVDVVARIDDVRAPIRVDRVLFARNPADWDLVGQSIQVGNLAACQHLRMEGKKLVEAADFAGPGDYLLPLRRVKTQWEVTPTPPSPGYPFVGPPQPGPPRLYAATRESLAQYAQLAKGDGKP